MALMLAVRAGMDKTDALRAVTSVPAKIAGMQDRIGSLKTGLDADCVLWSGDPLDIATQVQAVFVNGTPEYTTLCPQICGRRSWMVRPRRSLRSARPSSVT